MLNDDGCLAGWGGPRWRPFDTKRGLANRMEPAPAAVHRVYTQETIGRSPHSAPILRSCSRLSGAQTPDRAFSCSAAFNWWCRSLSRHSSGQLFYFFSPIKADQSRSSFVGWGTNLHTKKLLMMATRLNVRKRFQQTVKLLMTKSFESQQTTSSFIPAEAR